MGTQPNNVDPQLQPLNSQNNKQDNKYTSQEDTKFAVTPHNLIQNKEFDDIMPVEMSHMEYRRFINDIDLNELFNYVILLATSNS